MKKKSSKEPIQPVSGTKVPRFAGPSTFARLPELRDGTGGAVYRIVSAEPLHPFQAFQRIPLTPLQVHHELLRARK